MATTNRFSLDDDTKYHCHRRHYTNIAINNLDDLDDVDLTGGQDLDIIRRLSGVWKPLPLLFNAVNPPTINEDSGSGYYKGQMLYSSSDNNIWVSVDDTVGAAVWLLCSSLDENNLFGNNVGTGTAIYKNKVGTNLNFRSLKIVDPLSVLAYGLSGSGDEVELTPTFSNLSFHDLKNTTFGADPSADYTFMIWHKPPTAPDGWYHEIFELQNMKNVTISGVSDGEVLKWSTGSNAWINATDTGSTTLAGLTDISIGSLADKDLLQYDLGTNKWVNRTIANSLDQALTLNNLSDVAITSPVQDSLLLYDTTASDWLDRGVGYINALLNLVDLNDTTGTAGANGELAFWNLGILNHDTISSIAGNVTYGLNIGDLKNVNTSAVANYHALVYDSTGSSWDSGFISIESLDDSGLTTNPGTTNLSLFSQSSFDANASNNTCIFNDIQYNFTGHATNNRDNFIMGSQIGTRTTLTGGYILANTIVGNQCMNNVNLKESQGNSALGYRNLGLLAGVTSVYEHRVDSSISFGSNNGINPSNTAIGYVNRAMLIGTANRIDADATSVARDIFVFGRGCQSRDTRQAVHLGFGINGQNSSIGGVSIGRTHNHNGATDYIAIGRNMNHATSSTDCINIGRSGHHNGCTDSITLGRSSTQTTTTNCITIGESIPQSNNTDIIAMGRDYTLSGVTSNAMYVRWGANVLRVIGTSGTATVRQDTTTGEIGLQTCQQSMKNTIVNLDATLIDKALSLQPRSYYYNDAPFVQQKIGLVVEEVAPLMPEIINYGPRYESEQVWIDYKNSVKEWQDYQDAHDDWEANDQEGDEPQEPVNPLLSEPTPVAYDQALGIDFDNLAVTNLALFQELHKLVKYKHENNDVLCFGDTADPTGKDPGVYFEGNAMSIANGQDYDIRMKNDGRMSKRISARKYKENEVAVTSTETDLILDVPVKTYNLKVEYDPNTQKKVGLVCEDIDDLVGDYGGTKETYLVRDKNGDLDSLAYDRFIPALIKVCQDQQALITTLQSQIADHESRIITLEGGT